MLEGSTINIRAIRSEDLSALVNLLNDLEGKGPFLPLTLLSEAKMEREFRETGFVSDSSARYVITDKQDALLGLVWVFKSYPYFDAVEVGYQIFRQAHRGQGYATEALRLIANYIFESKPVNRVEVRMATENTASEKVAVKAGFTWEGTHREAAFSKGRLYDMHSYALLRREWAEGL